MKVHEVLDRARELVAHGWHEPFSLDAQGKLCSSDAEGIAKFCMVDALLVAARGDVLEESRAEEALTRQLQLLERDAALFAWLEAPERTHAEVLKLLARAEAHARVGDE
ncbi:MAG: DUF6197 family protein [Myxococcota bacterium]